MSPSDLTRRKLLALLGAGGLGLLTAAAGTENRGQPIDGGGPPNPVTTPGTVAGPASPTPDIGGEPTPGGQPSPEGDVDTIPSGVEDVREYGAAVDGRTDDTRSLMRALRAAGPDGTVWIPAGEVLISSERRDRIHALEIGPQIRRVTVRGAGADLSRIRLDGGHTDRHIGLLIGSESGQQFGEVRLENLTLDGNKARQRAGGKAIKTTADGGRLVLTDCRVTSWKSTGVNIEGGMDAVITYCHFDGNGLWENGGHAISANQRGRTEVRWSLLEGSGGVDIDVGVSKNAERQVVLVERCVLRNSRGSFKIDNENKLTTIRNTQLLGDNETTIPIKQNPKEIPIGRVVLDNVLIDGGGWPAIDIPAPGTIAGDTVAIKNVAALRELTEERNAAVYTEQLTWNAFGTLSVENVGPNGTGVALNINNSSGSIGEVILADGVAGVGSAEGVSIGRTTRGDSLVPDVPAVAEVGPRRLRF